MYKPLKYGSFEGLTAICLCRVGCRQTGACTRCGCRWRGVPRTRSFGEPRECRFRLLGSMNASVNYRKLGEPRVHFALNCSALGCPIPSLRLSHPLHDSPYSGRYTAGRSAGQIACYKPGQFICSLQPCLSILPWKRTMRVNKYPYLE
jgi:hypothetical protein